MIDDDNNNDKGKDGAEQKTGPANDDNKTDATEQKDGGQNEGENGVEQKCTEAGEDDGGSGGKENSQPQNAASSSTVPLQPDSMTQAAPIAPVVSSASVGQQTLDKSDNNQVKKCFKCVETFVHEAALLDHLLHFHGVRFVKTDDTPNGEAKPGRYVVNPKKRKRISSVDQNRADDHAVKRKATKKPLSETN